MTAMPPLVPPVFPLPASSMSERSSALHGRGEQGRGKGDEEQMLLGKSLDGCEYEPSEYGVEPYDGMPFESGDSMSGGSFW